jgi:hypothetical protein
MLLSDIEFSNFECVFPVIYYSEMSLEMTSQWPQRVLLPASISSLVLSLAYILLVIIRSPSDAQCIEDMYPYCMSQLSTSKTVKVQH